MFVEKYSDIFSGTKEWQSLEVTSSSNYAWDKSSTYINNPPYFENIGSKNSIKDIKSARILAIFGDSITTDHISPAGSISKTSPAAKYLTDHQISPIDFNSYGSRRGNHEVMMRGTFANIRIKNEMCKGVEGGFTINQLKNMQQTIYDAAMDYKANGVSAVILPAKNMVVVHQETGQQKVRSCLVLKLLLLKVSSEYIVQIWSVWEYYR